MAETRVAASDIIDPVVFEEVWSFLTTNYGESAETMLQALMCIDMSSAILHKELNVPSFNIELED
jgi:hypothetical protein